MKSLRDKNQEVLRGVNFSGTYSRVISGKLIRERRKGNSVVFEFDSQASRFAIGYLIFASLRYAFRDHLAASWPFAMGFGVVLVGFVAFHVFLLWKKRTIGEILRIDLDERVVTRADRRIPFDQLKGIFEISAKDATIAEFASDDLGAGGGRDHYLYLIAERSDGSLEGIRCVCGLASDAPLSGTFGEFRLKLTELTQTPSQFIDRFPPGYLATSSVPL